jgi:hypothetical protein
MARKKEEISPKLIKELVVWTGEVWDLVKDGLKIYLTSGTGFYPKETKTAKINLRVTVEEI